LSQSHDDLSALLAAPPQPTRRACAPALEEQLYRVNPVLDHGFVRVIDYMGTDEAIVQAARVSYGAGTKQHTGDRGLIRYLMRHRHTSPFEMCAIKLHVKLPIFVARQWIRHRTASVNEVSARYSILEHEFYLPSPTHLAEQSSDNKQGRKEEAISAAQAAEVLALLERDARHTYATYEHLLNDDGSGDPADPARPQLARELARINLSLGMYTEWYWKIDLHNLLHFLSLRLHAHAQYEIRVYAEVIGQLVSAWVPLAWEAFEDYRLGGASFSKQELALLRALVERAGPEAGLGASGLGARERKEFRDKLGL